MKKTIVNLELDIKRDPGYKLVTDIYKKTFGDFKANIQRVLFAGKHFERTYSIRHDKECTKKENEYITTLANLEFSQYEQMYNELLELKKENVILKQVLKQNNINSITIEHLKYYGENEELAI